MKTITIEIDLKIKNHDGIETSKSTGAVIHTDDPLYSLLLDYYKDIHEDLATALVVTSSDMDKVVKLFDIAMEGIHCTCPGNKMVAE